MVVAALAVGRCSVDMAAPPVVTVREVVPPTELLHRIAALQMEANGLRAKLAARSVQKPDTIFSTDTLVSPPDTVLQAFVFSRGKLELAPLIQRDTLWSPELHKYDVSRCDDGFSWASGALVCDRSRLGHFTPYAALSSTFLGQPSLGAGLGLAWKRSYAATWGLTAEFNTDRQIVVAFTREF